MPHSRVDPKNSSIAVTLLEGGVGACLTAAKPPIASVVLFRRRLNPLVWLSLCCVVLSLHIQATFYALRATYGYLSPELWTATRYTKSPMQEFTDFLAKPTIGDVPRAPPVTTY